MEISDGEPEAWFWGVGINLAQAGVISVTMISTGMGGGGGWSVLQMEWFSRRLITSLMTHCHFVKVNKRRKYN